MKKLFSIFLAAVSVSLTFLIQSCYPIGEGGAVFFMCPDCISQDVVYVYVDGEKIGQIDGVYAEYCTQSCDDQSPSFTGKAGDHIYTIKSASGTVLDEGTFNIRKQKCEEVSFRPQGCVSSGGGGGGGNLPPSNYDVQGTVYVKSTTVKFSFYDGSTIDNDRIKVVFNGNTEAANLLISGSKQTMTITNMPANSWLGIVAVSEGDIPPCTPDVDVYDGYSTQTFVIRSYINEPGAYIIKLN